MCINAKYSISIVNHRLKKVFKYEKTELPIIKYKDEIWFKAVAVATVLRYKNTMKSIRDHVDPEDKKKLSELGSKTKQNETFWSKGNEGNTIYINESGLHSLIFQSKLPSAREFKRWVTKDVLPSLRRTGSYYCNETYHKYYDSLVFEIKNETGLHIKVVSFLKRRYPHSLFLASLGENECMSELRISSFRKRYLHGTPDLVITNFHKRFTGFVIELKSPKWSFDT